MDVLRVEWVNGNQQWMIVGGGLPAGAAWDGFDSREAALTEARAIAEDIGVRAEGVAMWGSLTWMLSGLAALVLAIVLTPDPPPTRPIYVMREARRLRPRARLWVSLLGLSGLASVTYGAYLMFH